jgi:hypothetical protein
MGLGDGTSMYGKSALDEPTGTKKYSMAPMSAGEKAASRERKSNNLIDRNLQRAMRRGSPAERIAAGQLYQKRSSTPGYQQGGGIASADDNREADRITASNYTKEGLQLKNNSNQNVNPGTAQDANDVERGPVNVIGRELPGGTTPYTNTPTPFQGSYSPEYFAKEAFRTEPNISEKGTNPNNIAEGLASTQGVGNANNPVPVATTSQEAPAATTSPATPNTPAPLDTMADRGNSKIAGYQKATADAKTKFANDLKQYGTSGQRSPEKDAQIREYGKTLNLNEDQINAAMRGDTKLDAKSAAASTLAYEKNVANKAANTPEARNKKSTDEFSKAYGNYLNGEGKGASKEERAAKYDELKGKATKDGFAVTKEAKDKVSEDRFNARVERAVKTGMSREEAIQKTSRTDNSTQQALDLIPGAKKEVAAIVNSAEKLSTEPSLRDYEGAERAETLSESYRKDGYTQQADDWQYESAKRGGGLFDANLERLKKSRGAPAISDVQRQIVSEGSSVQGRGGVELDSVIPSGNPLIDGVLDGSIKTSSKEFKSSQPEIGEGSTVVDNSSSSESGRNPILEDLENVGKTWDAIRDTGRAAVKSQGKAENNFAKEFTKTVGGGLIDAAGSVVGVVGDKTGKAIKRKADDFDEIIDNLNINSNTLSSKQKTALEPGSSKQKTQTGQPSNFTGLDGTPQEPYTNIPVGRPSPALRPQPVLKRPPSNPQASVNTKRSIQKSATDVLSFSDNLNKYLV